MEYFAFQWHITDACDQRCEHCYIFSEGHPKLVEMPWERLLRDWNIPEDMIARCFVTLGYPLGEYPKPKPRKNNRTLIIE